ncbi:radical SAM protein [Desulfoprunum benzoelyticum]|uniref:Histone acetyltransferase (RNA polymerase elongator complex component) n=1 Tax=Desulfoprunum benzoelyticum TaxID=1506996 RepID=A0A840UUR9_9BACT|nr:radical SAM protein [Desulfoprunum benzoelyticum]MBB5349435.1 histone acetyltransferase (RNA polymerase elongator complex component) [Desulfoprunum benzoelyticum]MBM9531708.1 radical SAM protein [Desulfoprunum benzoelyticum]
MPLVIPLFIPHRGCPHLCLFCNQHSVTAAGQAASDAAAIGDIIRTWIDRSPGRDEVQAAFFGGSFTCLPQTEQERLLAAVRPFVDSGEVHSIRLSTRPDCIDAETCRFLRDHRVGIVEIGVQSFDDQVLRAARRGHTAADSRRAVELLQQAGITVGIQLMPGLPGETHRSFIAGIRQTIVLAPAVVRLYPAVVLRNTGLEEEWQAGRYRPLSLNQAVAKTARAKELLAAAGIRVIRMGLQPSAELEAGIVAGPYHPAFGECVQSRLWFKRIRRRLACLTQDEHLTIRISGRDRSAIVGRHRVTLRRLAALGYASLFTLEEDRRAARGSVEYIVGQRPPSCPS